MHQNGYRHDIKYINWYKEADFKTIDQDTFESVYSSLNGPKLAKKTVRKGYRNGYYLEDKGNYKRLYYKDELGYHVASTNAYDNRKNLREHKGSDAIKRVKDMFVERYGIKLKNAFGYAPLEFKLICSPKQFYYTNDRYMDGKLRKGISSVDFTSHYPGCTKGKLPDYNTAITLPGTVKPSEEYPFAFYIKSGHIAEYNVFDTHNWVDCEYSDRLFVHKDEYRYESSKKILVHKKQLPTLTPDQDETVLMKASQYELGWLYEELFAKRHDDEIFKDAMNCSIGYFATAKYDCYKLAHVRAIILGRANQKMLDIAANIRRSNIVQICVDGMIYIGSKILGIDTKVLGKLKQEYTTIEGVFTGLNRYILGVNGHIIKYKHSGCDMCVDNSNIDNPTSYEDIYKWTKRKKNYE